MREFTEKQKEKIRKELSLDYTSKYRRFLYKLQDRFDLLRVGRHVLPANIIYLEELCKAIKTLKLNGYGFVIQVPVDGPYCTTSISLYDDILTEDIDEIILKHTKFQHYKRDKSSIIVDFNGIFNEIDKQVKAFLKSLDKKKKDE